ALEWAKKLVPLRGAFSQKIDFGCSSGSCGQRYGLRPDRRTINVVKVRVAADQYSFHAYSPTAIRFAPCTAPEYSSLSATNKDGACTGWSLQAFCQRVSNTDLCQTDADN